jgi:UDP-N-acetylglucosamine 2-epimerase (hydrolysing)
LVGTSGGVIVPAVLELLDDERAYRRMAHAHYPYGDGQASERIAAALASELAPVSVDRVAQLAAIDLAESALIPNGLFGSGHSARATG